jgi:hypothetical protein
VILVKVCKAMVNGVKLICCVVVVSPKVTRALDGQRHAAMLCECGVHLRIHSNGL